MAPLWDISIHSEKREGVWGVAALVVVGGAGLAREVVSIERGGPFMMGESHVTSPFF